MPDHLTGPNDEAEAAHLSINLSQMRRPYLIRRNRKAHLLLINPRVGQRVWGCKYTLHRPVGRANESLPQLSVSMAASLTQCLLNLHHEQCVRNARRILPFGGTLIERELDRCPT